MTDPAPQPADCDDSPKLTAAEWAFVETVAAEEANQGGDPK